MTRAAVELGTTKGVVSKTLFRLERRIGEQLFLRTTRRLAITPLGERLHLRAQAILAEIGAMLEDARQDPQDLRGTLSIAAPPDLGARLSEGLFGAYLKRHPETRIRLRLAYDYEDLFEAATDLAFRVGQVKDDSMVAKSIGSFFQILVAAPEWVDRLKNISSGDALAPYCLPFSNDEGIPTWTLIRGDERLTIEPQGRFGSRSFPALLGAARAGLGVALVPDFVATEDLARGDLIQVLPSWRSQVRPIYLIHRFGHQRVRRVAAMLDLLRENPEFLPVSGAAR